MIFDRSDVENIPSYGDVVSASEVVKKVEDMIMRNLAFEPDYYDGDRVRLDVAEDFLIELRRIIKDMDR